MGKTVLLNEFGRIASRERWIHAHVQATEDVRVARGMASRSRRVLLELSMVTRARERTSRALGVLRSFIEVHVPMGGDLGSLVIDFEPVQGHADSGDLDADLSGLFTELGEAARTAGKGVLFTTDEIQISVEASCQCSSSGCIGSPSLACPSSSLGPAFRLCPVWPARALSYAERLFRYVDIGSLNVDDARQALTAAVEDEGARSEPSAVDQVILDTQGYPYFLQEFGKQAWTLAEGEAITPADVEDATRLAIDDLDHGFFQARVDKTTDAERDYLRAMADLGGPGPYRSGDVSRQLGKKTTQTGPTPHSLIKRGLCYAPRHGELAFTVPMFDEFVRRALS